MVSNTARRDGLGWFFDSKGDRWIRPVCGFHGIRAIGAAIAMTAHWHLHGRGLTREAYAINVARYGLTVNRSYGFR